MDPLDGLAEAAADHMFLAVAASHWQRGYWHPIRVECSPEGYCQTVVVVGW
jgi:hypothetical protein